MTQMKSLDVEIVSSDDNTLPASGLVQLSLLDVSLADGPSVSLAELRLRCAGRFPVRLQLTFDSSQIDPRHSYSLAVRIEQDGQLLYINTSQHPVDLQSVTGSQQVTVDKIDSNDEGYFCGTVEEGIHGGNLTDGIHGGNRMD
ncbi:hypothetical protein F3J44_25395 [Pantoea sp. Tr-811]|uniref:YbaY family lipoprotein n=1 Tax=Pantoea sp. Tr-811 TaxID=2608361 RepID=UPI0014248B2C|nr:YbaY family lipoprotein [Pantoea sp. Tr-811]NIF29687.1 hypothetical protein [Pantoea sp. Tr-811]